MNAPQVSLRMGVLILCNLVSNPYCNRREGSGW